MKGLLFPSLWQPSILVIIISLWQSLSCVCQEVSFGAEGQRLVDRVLHLRGESESNQFFPTSASHKVSVVRRGVYKKGAIRRRIGDGEKKLTAGYHPSLNLAPWQNPCNLNIKEHGGRGNIFLVSFKCETCVRDDLAFSTFSHRPQNHSNCLPLYLGRVNINWNSYFGFLFALQGNLGKYWLIAQLNLFSFEFLF